MGFSMPSLPVGNSAIREIGNRLTNRFHKPFSRVYYVTEPGNWSIAWDGQYITRAVSQQAKIPCQTTLIYKGITNQIIHFGSRSAYLNYGMRNVDSSNKVVFTWFHGDDADPNPDNQRMIKDAVESSHFVSKIVTSSSIGRERLIHFGIPESLITNIPLGIDLDMFSPGKESDRETMRNRLGIPDDSICIGSFQKDGVGWSEGLEPKLIKGPDLFLDAVERIAASRRIFVLLTGPARGYVKSGLEKLGVPYAHTYLNNYLDIVPYFRCLDLYLVTSRDEGGPKAILECMATGIPIISSRVGMAPDIIQSGENGFMVEVGDTDGVELAAEQLMSDPNLRANVIANGIQTAVSYSWSSIAKRYFEEVYGPLLA
jgi:glycosyltransferase involved in cell wall biosynthesis